MPGIENLGSIHAYEGQPFPTNTCLRTTVNLAQVPHLRRTPLGLDTLTLVIEDRSLELYLNGILIERRPGRTTPRALHSEQEYSIGLVFDHSLVQTTPANFLVDSLKVWPATKGMLFRDRDTARSQ